MMELVRGESTEGLDFHVLVDPERHKKIRDDVHQWANGSENCGGRWRIYLRDPLKEDPDYRVVYMFDNPANAVDMRVRFG